MDLHLLCPRCGVVLADAQVIDGMLVARCVCGKSRVYAVAEEGYRPRAYVAGRRG